MGRTGDGHWISAPAPEIIKDEDLPIESQITATLEQLMDGPPSARQILHREKLCPECYGGLIDGVCQYCGF